jgi:hypothetical protein
VVFGLALFFVLASIYPIAVFDTQAAAKKLVTPILTPDDEEPAANLSENDDDTLTPTLVPASGESAPLEAAETDNDQQASEAKEAAFAGRFGEEPAKADEAARRNGSLGGLSNSPAGRPPGYPVVPKPDLPSFGPLPSVNPTAASQDPAQTPADAYYDETLQQPSLETTLPDSPTGAGTPYPQLPSDLSADTQTPLQTPSNPPPDAGPSPPPPPPDTLGAVPPGPY